MPKRQLKKKTQRRRKTGGAHYEYAGPLAPGIPNWK